MTNVPSHTSQNYKILWICKVLLCLFFCNKRHQFWQRVDLLILIFILLFKILILVVFFSGIVVLCMYLKFFTVRKNSGVRIDLSIKQDEINLEKTLTIRLAYPAKVKFVTLQWHRQYKDEI